MLIILSCLIIIFKERRFELTKLIAENDFHFSESDNIIFSGLLCTMHRLNCVKMIMKRKRRDLICTVIYIIRQFQLK